MKTRSHNAIYALLIENWQQTIPLVFALACYWPLFVSPVFPAELFPGYTYASASFVHSAVFTMALLLFGVLALITKAKFCNSKRLLTGIMLVLIGLIAFLLMTQLSGVVLSAAFYWVYPVVLGIYCLLLTIQITARLLSFKMHGATSAILLLSLVLSLALGFFVSYFSELIGLLHSDSSYPLAVFSGLFVMLCPSETALAKPQRAHANTSHQASLFFVIALTCYLIGSGASMGAYSSTNDGVWLSDNIIHLLGGVILYVLAASYALIALRRKNNSGESTTNTFIPWLIIFLLFIALLYCVSLLNSEAADLCAEIILPSRPLAMVLLWLLAFYLLSDKTEYKPYLMAFGAITIAMTNTFADAYGVFATSQEMLTSIVNAIALIMAFSMTVCVIVGIFFGARSTLNATSKQPCSDSFPHGENGSLLNPFANKYNLTSREREVMALIAKGYTQKKIADELYISINSVQTHAKTLYRKLEVHSRQELIDLVHQESSK